MVNQVQQQSMNSQMKLSLDIFSVTSLEENVLISSHVCLMLNIVWFKLDFHV